MRHVHPGVMSMTQEVQSIVRFKQLRERVGLSRSEIRRRELAGEFPCRVRLGPRSVGWLTEEVNNWVAERARERENHPLRAA